MSELIVLDEVSPAEIFQGEGMNELLERIRVEAISFVPETKTAKGRKEIASIAAKVAKCKTYLDGKGKDIVDELKKQPKLIDAKRKEMREFLDDLKANVRDPLTQWETIEAERIVTHEVNIREMLNAGIHARDDWQSIGLDAMEDRLKELEAEVIGENYDEFESEALLVRDEAVLLTASAIGKKKAAIAEQEELETLRAEKAKREQEDQARIAAEEAMKAEKEKLEKEEKRIKDEAEATAKAMIEKAERDKQDAIEAKERAEQQAKDATAKAEREAEEKQRKEQEDLAAREADKKHRGKINREAVDALILSGMDAGAAKSAIIVIAKGMIPNVKINY